MPHTAMASIEAPGEAGAPRYACIPGVGAVDEIGRRLLAAMDTGGGNAS
jgi:hypothetical protein